MRDVRSPDDLDEVRRTARALVFVDSNQPAASHAALARRNKVI